MSLFDNFLTLNQFFSLFLKMNLIGKAILYESPIYSVVFP